MGDFTTVGLEEVIEAFSNREQATVEAIPKMLKAGAGVLYWYRLRREKLPCRMIGYKRIADIRNGSEVCK